MKAKNTFGFGREKMTVVIAGADISQGKGPWLPAGLMVDINHMTNGDMSSVRPAMRLTFIK